jgi:hypothetical protein
MRGEWICPQTGRTGAVSVVHNPQGIYLYMIFSGGNLRCMWQHNEFFTNGLAGSRPNRYQLYHANPPWAYVSKSHTHAIHMASQKRKTNVVGVAHQDLFWTQAESKYLYVPYLGTSTGSYSRWGPKDANDNAETLCSVSFTPRKRFQWCQWYIRCLSNISANTVRSHMRNG